MAQRRRHGESSSAAKEVATDYPIVRNDASAAGVRYRAADNQRIADEGSRKILVRPSGGTTRGLNMHVGGVCKGLISVADMVDAGHVVVFQKDGSYARNLQTNEMLHFTRRNRVYELDVDLIPYAEAAKTIASSAAPFGRPGSTHP